MNFISRWMYNKLSKSYDNEYAKVKGCEVATGDVVSNEDYGQPLKISMYNAHGGKIVTFHSYDRASERSNNSTYIIHPDEELAESLSKLIAMEEMKR